MVLGMSPKQHPECQGQCCTLPWQCGGLDNTWHPYHTDSGWRRDAGASQGPSTAGEHSPWCQGSDPRHATAAFMENWISPQSWAVHPTHLRSERSAWVVLTEFNMDLMQDKMHIALIIKAKGAYSSWHCFLTLLPKYIEQWCSQICDKYQNILTHFCVFILPSQKWWQLVSYQLQWCSYC